MEGVSALTGLRGRPIAEFPRVLDSLAGSGVPFSVIGEVSRPPEDEGALSFRTPDEQIFDRLRRKRNMALYDDTGFVSHRDAEQALDAARSYLGVIRADITARKP